MNEHLILKIIDASCLADSSAIIFTISQPKSLAACVEFLINVMKLDCHKGPINCVEMSIQTLHYNHILSDFWSSYAYQMLLALGYRIKCQITTKYSSENYAIIKFIKR